MDQMARQDTPIHRLDPRAKILTTLAFIGVTVSFGRYEIAALLPLILFPVVLLALGRVPAGVHPPQARLAPSPSSSSSACSTRSSTGR